MNMGEDIIFVNIANFDYIEDSVLPLGLLSLLV